MNGYNQICSRVEGNECDRWTDGTLFDNVCSVEYGAGCAIKPGPSGTPSGIETMKQAFAQQSTRISPVRLPCPISKTKLPILVTA